jgi:hypothetical protein
MGVILGNEPAHSAHAQWLWADGLLAADRVASTALAASGHRGATAPSELIRAHVPTRAPIS